MTSSRGNGDLPEPFRRRKNGETLWVARWVDERGRRRERTARRLEDAVAKRDQALAGRQPSGTLAIYLSWWTDTFLVRRVTQERLSENTRLAYDSAVRCHIVPRVGDTRLDQLTVAVVEDLLDRVAAEPSPATGRRVGSRMVGVVHETLRSALATAVRRELLDRNPAELAEAPRRVRREVEPLSRDEARAFVDIAGADRLAALWLVALGCGLRKGEALALRWPDVDLDAGTMRVGPSLVRRDRRWLLTRGKGAPVTLALPGFATTALRAHRRAQAEERMAAGPYWQPATVETPAGSGVLDDLVFTTPEGAPIESSAVNTRLHEVCDRAGMRRMSPHELRHQCASLLLAQGATMAEVQLALRHASQAITSSTYAHLHDEVRREWADRMDGLLGERDG